MSRQTHGLVNTSSQTKRFVSADVSDFMIAYYNDWNLPMAIQNLNLGCAINIYILLISSVKKVGAFHIIAWLVEQ